MSRRLSVTLAAAALALTTAAGTTAAVAHDDDGAHTPESISKGSVPDRSTNVRRLAHVNPGPGANADVYAHAGHAYLASWIGKSCPSKGVRVYNLANPKRPRHVSTLASKAREPRLRGTWTEKVIVKHVRTPGFTGDLAVVSFQPCRLSGTAFRGFGLYDVTRPAHPRRLALVPTGNRTGGSHEIWLEAARGQAYVYTAVIDSELTTAPNATTPGRPDFRIYRVTNPRRPAEIGGWGAWAELGLHPKPNDKIARFVHSVRTNDAATRAYLSYWDLGTVILDIRDPRHPRYLGRTPSGQGHAHSVDVSADGKVLVETHETGAGRPVYYDISDPAHPRRLSSLYPRGYRNTSVHDAKFKHGRTYFSWYDLGVAVADSRNPSRPRIVARFATRSDYRNPQLGCLEYPCTFVWGVFPYRDYVLASDMNSGLYVFRVRR